jgi:streptomycin 6-kinase
VLAHARVLLDRRARAWDPRRAVVVHGDPHVGNMLPVLGPRPGAVDGQVFIDPDGFLADPAYDLGVLVREWNEALLADPDPVSTLRGWCCTISRSPSTLRS